MLICEKLEVINLYAFEADIFQNDTTVMRSRVIVKYCKNLREEKGDLPREKKKIQLF